MPSTEVYRVTFQQQPRRLPVSPPVETPNSPLKTTWWPGEIPKLIEPKEKWRWRILSPMRPPRNFSSRRSGFIFKVLYSLKKEKEKNTTMQQCRCHKEEQISFLCFQLNQPLKKIQGAFQGCWSSRGTHSWSAIKWPLGRAICVLLPTEQPISTGTYAEPICGFFVWWLHSRLRGWGRLGESAHVVQQCIWAALYAYLFLSLLSPLCVFLMGISVRCAGVQSHCGLKRISDDRKYVNLLFPSG